MTRLRNERADRRRRDGGNSRWYSDCGCICQSLYYCRRSVGPGAFGLLGFFFIQYVYISYTVYYTSMMCMYCLSAARVPDAKAAYFSNFRFLIVQFNPLRTFSPHPTTMCRYRNICRVSSRSNALFFSGRILRYNIIIAMLSCGRTIERILIIFLCIHILQSRSFSCDGSEWGEGGGGGFRKTRPCA